MYSWIFEKKYLRRFIAHGILFVLLTWLLLWIVHNQYPMRNDINWIALINFSFLTIGSYGFFTVNNVYYERIKSMALSLGFFLTYLGFAFITLGMLFDSPADLLIMLASIFGAQGFIITAYGILQWVKYNTEVKRNIRLKAELDPLTQLYNRRAFAGHAARDVVFAENTESPLSLLVIDIDDFKPINDRYGHDVGDAVLIKLTALLKAKMRKTDRLYRWGGEEFVAILPVTSNQEAQALASKMLLLVEEQSFDTGGEGQFNITLSIGVAEWKQGESLATDTFKRADQGLYWSKQRGKNRVSSYH